MVRDVRRHSVYLFGAICPERGFGAASIIATITTEAMNEHLNEISTQVAAWEFLIQDPDRIRSLGHRDWTTVKV